jgi:hypothetical protein
LRASLVMMAALFAFTGVAASNGYCARNTAVSTEQFILNGVIVDGEQGIAWLFEPTLTPNEVIALRPGESIGPYRLTKVLDDRVEMEGPSGTVMIPLYSSGAGVPPTAVVSARRSTFASVERGASSGSRAGHTRGRARDAAQARGQRLEQGLALSEQASRTAEPRTGESKTASSESSDAKAPSGAEPVVSPKAEVSTSPPPSLSFGAITPQEIVPPPPLQYLQQALQQAREAREAAQAADTAAQATTGAQTDATAAAASGSNGVITFKKGDPRLRKAFQSFFGGR